MKKFRTFFALILAALSVLMITAVTAFLLVAPAWALTQADYDKYVKTSKYFARAVKDLDTELQKGKKFMSEGEFGEMESAAKAWIFDGGIEEAAKAWDEADLKEDRPGIYSQLLDNYKIRVLEPAIRRSFLKNNPDANMQGVYVLQDDSITGYLSIKTVSKKRSMVTLEAWRADMTATDMLKQTYRFVFEGYGAIGGGKLTARAENSAQSPDMALHLTFDEDTVTVELSDAFKEEFIGSGFQDEVTACEGVYVKAADGAPMYGFSK
jgi:hypothetical protein